MEQPSLPNGRVLLEALMLTPEMLRALPKVPVPVAALRGLISVLVADLRFDEAFYGATYPDLPAARDAGAIADLHTHFVEHGYIEGRIGSAPEIDEEFYFKMYPDIAAAVRRGDIGSAAEHFLKAGAGEGRFANPAHMEACRYWEKILGRR